MTYAFHTTDKLCFILDLMNGGDLHYHLSQHGVFSEKDVRFYAAEVLLGKNIAARKCLQTPFVILFPILRIVPYAPALLTACML